MSRRAPIVACALLCFGAVAAAQDASSAGFRFERFEARFALMAQTGRGFQSQADVDAHGRGDEHAWIAQPIFYARVRQSESVVHEVYLPVDIVSAASVDALDAVSTASRENEAASLDLYSTVEADEDTRFTLHWGGHLEETLRSAFLGVATTRDFADDNAVLALSADFIFDSFDGVNAVGYNDGNRERVTASFNASLSQVLSPSTVASLGYGVTAQRGTLHTTWNSVALDGALDDTSGSTRAQRIGDRFPSMRLRHALSARLAQAIPVSGTTLALESRFYRDDLGVDAHTAEFGVTQALGARFSLRADYRFHAQSAPTFWTQRLSASFDPSRPRTSDSDLARLHVHEASLTARWYYALDGARTRDSSYLELSVLHYARSNNLRVELISLGWGVALD